MQGTPVVDATDQVVDFAAITYCDSTILRQILLRFVLAPCGRTNQGACPKNGCSIRRKPRRLFDRARCGRQVLGVVGGRGKCGSQCGVSGLEQQGIGECFLGLAIALLAQPELPQLRRSLVQSWMKLQRQLVAPLGELLFAGIASQNLHVVCKSVEEVKRSVARVEFEGATEGTRSLCIRTAAHGLCAQLNEAVSNAFVCGGRKSVILRKRCLFSQSINRATSLQQHECDKTEGHRE